MKNKNSTNDKPSKKVLIAFGVIIGVLILINICALILSAVIA